ncbi:hypothetical protein [Hymenobacter sp. DG01]|uniref:hypothetical protein n=1 Tax=Hymenobacter sp. DG01 TaxID=2584940 RepID=UPI0015E0596A|nr:hypothetical protein [Hymenobacter sp. DG01]
MTFVLIVASCKVFAGLDSCKVFDNKQSASPSYHKFRAGYPLIFTLPTTPYET